jgi:hypothetical protein
MGSVMSYGRMRIQTNHLFATPNAAPSPPAIMIRTEILAHTQHRRQLQYESICLISFFARSSIRISF